MYPLIGDLLECCLQQIFSALQQSLVEFHGNHRVYLKILRKKWNFVINMYIANIVCYSMGCVGSVAYL